MIEPDHRIPLLLEISSVLSASTTKVKQPGLFRKTGQLLAKERRPPVAASPPASQKFTRSPFMGCNGLQNDLGYGIVRSANAWHEVKKSGGHETVTNRGLSHRTHRRERVGGRPAL
jgi:hypothetical protein